MSYGSEITETFQRETLANLLAQCTQSQQDLFKRLYPNGVQQDQLNWAITQCYNTIKKNAAKVGQ